jgi:hypothetical protein
LRKIADSCHKLLGEKKDFYAAIKNQTPHRGAASKASQTRAETSPVSGAWSFSTPHKHAVEALERGSVKFISS